MTSRNNNLNTLTKNILHGLYGACVGNDELYVVAEDMFFWWLSKKEKEIEAELLTLGWVEVHMFLHHVLPLAGSQHPKWTREIQDDLISFFKKRYVNWVPDNREDLVLLCLNESNHSIGQRVARQFSTETTTSRVDEEKTEV